MSTNLAYARPLRRTGGQLEVVEQPRRVRIVTTRAQRRARPKLVYGLGASAVIFAIFLAQLLITIALSSGAYTITGLQSAEQGLGRTSNALTERLDTLSSSQNLQANALALGMVNSSQAAFLRLSNGAVLGSASPAGASSVTATTPPAADGVPNSLLTAIPLINSTGVGHGDSNAPVSTTNNSESTQGSTAPASTGTAVSTPPNSSNSGDLPSPVTH
jgi:hypothetical protein